MSDDEPMPRTPRINHEPESRADILDFTTGYALDAVEAGVDADAVASALREAADEVDYQARERNLEVSER